MKKLLLNLTLAMMIAISLTSCSPRFWDVVTDVAIIEEAILDDIVVGYYVPGYYFYDGFWHRNSVEYNHRHNDYLHRHHKK
jgi:hypothetical protein